MGDMVVANFVGTLGRLLSSSSNHDFNEEVKYQLHHLFDQMTYLVGFLHVTEKQRNKYPEVMKIVMQIRDVTCDAENIIDVFVPLVSKAYRPSDSPCDYPDHLFPDIERVKKVIENLVEEVKQTYDENKYEIGERSCIKHEANVEVSTFLWTLKKILSSSDLDSNCEVRYQLQHLYEGMTYLGQFINVTEKKRNKHPEVMKIVMQISDVTCAGSDAWNILEVLAPLVYKADRPSDSLCEYPDHLFLDLERVKEVIQNLMDEVKQVYDENMYDINGVEHSSNKRGGVSGSSGGRNPYRGAKDEVVIGFEDEIKKIMDLLFDNWEGMSTPNVIQINGAAGSGKTTLAKELYDHHLTRENFDIRAWLVVSQDYNTTRRRALLIGILKSARENRKKKYEKSDVNELGEKVYEFLSGRRYLIVMDDMWGNQAWNDIERSLPRGQYESKVIFTSRQPVGVQGFNSRSHDVRSLSVICSWELLEKKVFGRKRCPQELVEIGKKIAKQCEGLPIAIIATAGILANEEKTIDAWEKIANHLISIIAEKQKGCMEILELSYNDLPLYLKACFLYIGAHPRNYEIPVHELIWSWIAEGFIQQLGDFGDGKSLETLANYCLRRLIHRNLVMVVKKSNSVGEVKACRIHDLWRELCLKKAKEDKFFLQIDGDDSSAFSATNKHSHLFIFREFFDEFFFSRPYPRNIHSLLCLGSRHTRIALHISFFAETFKLLRVLSFIPDECQGEILRGQLIHLRYLALQLSETADFRFPFHLVKLETLIVQTRCFKDIKLSSNILEMVNLRNLYSKQGMFTYHVSCVEDEGNTLDSLQTLHKMCICKHCLSFLKKTPNLKKLGLRRDPDTKGDDVLMLPDLEFLEYLEILYVESMSVARTGLKLPLTLTKLTLCHTQLQWEELSKILEPMPSLQFLKLLKDACSGPVWNTSELQKTFSPRLRYLRLKDLDIEEWRAFKDQFPDLEVLVIQDCRKLKWIPLEFGCLDRLCEIKVERSSRSVEELAKRFREGQKIFQEIHWPNLILSCNSW